MRFEHFALNVADVHALVRWYVEHLGLQVIRQRPDAPYTTFLGDENGRVFLEVYSDPARRCVDFSKAHPLVFHIAFHASDAAGVGERLVEAGAVSLGDKRQTDGSRIISVRDPWGYVLQFCQRTQPFPGF